jgi:hypothetical protein
MGTDSLQQFNNWSQALDFEGYGEPILLTTEILERCGFVKCGFTYDKGKLSIHLPSINYENGRTYYNSWCIIEESPQSLHQLQNLYFALTRTELNYTL